MFFYGPLVVEQEIVRIDRCFSGCPDMRYLVVQNFDNHVRSHRKPAHIDDAFCRLRVRNGRTPSILVLGVYYT